MDTKINITLLFSDEVLRRVGISFKGRGK